MDNDFNSAVLNLVAAARQEAARLRDLARTADDRGADILDKMAQQWDDLATGVETALRGA